jgi:hypothetical protein
MLAVMPSGTPRFSTLLLLALTLTWACDRREKNPVTIEKFEALQERVVALEARVKAQEESRRTKGVGLDLCLLQADTKYWNYVKLNGHIKKSTAEGDIWNAPTHIWNHAEQIKRNAIEACRILHTDN